MPSLRSVQKTEFTREGLWERPLFQPKSVCSIHKKQSMIEKPGTEDIGNIRRAGHKTYFYILGTCIYIRPPYIYIYMHEEETGKHMLRTFICSILQCSRFTLNNFRHIRFNSLDTLSVQVPALPQVQLYRPRTLDWIRIQKNPWRRQPRAFTWLCSCMNSKQSRLSLSWLTNNIPMYMTIRMHTWAFLSWIGS